MMGVGCIHSGYSVADIATGPSGYSVQGHCMLDLAAGAGYIDVCFQCSKIKPHRCAPGPTDKSWIIRDLCSSCNLIVHITLETVTWRSLEVGVDCQNDNQ